MYSKKERAGKSEILPNKIVKIDPKIKKYARANRLNPKQTEFLQYYLLDPSPRIRGNAVQSYMKAYPNAEYLTAQPAGCRLVNDNKKVVKTIEDILGDENVTKESVVRKHKELINGAQEAGQYSSAINGNRDFMEMLGIKKEEKTIKHEHSFNLDLKGLSDKELDEKILELNELDTIEGEIIE